MIILFFVLAGIGTVALMFHVTLEFNAIEKKTEELTQTIGKHYEY